jgi:potassium efflux system protein
MRYYLMSIGLIVPLIMALIMFDNLNDREFSGSLGRLCFMLICGALAIVTLSLKRAGIPLYLDKSGSGENMFNRLLWNLLLSAPLFAMLAAAVGIWPPRRRCWRGWKPRWPSGSCCWWCTTLSAAGC